MATSPRRGATSARTFTYVVYKRGNNTDPIKRALERRPGWTAVPTEDIREEPTWSVNFVWKPTWTQAKPPGHLLARGHAHMSKRQVVNHFKAVEPLTTKDSLFECMHAYYMAVGEDPYRHVPVTFCVDPKPGVPADAWPGWSEFQESFRKYAADTSLANLWLIKPTCLNRGIGIEVERDLDSIRTFLEGKARGASMGIHTTWVLQKYIENLLLYHGRKFDIRVWVLALDSGDVYMHAPGYVRTCSEMFDLRATDRYAHLSNYCQQVNAASFGKFEEGNTLTFMDLQEYLTEHVLPQLRRKRGDAGTSPDGRRPGASTASTAKLVSAMVSPEPSAAAEGATAAHVSAADKPIHEAVDGCEALWGCGRQGLWGQMRSAVIDTFEALRGRGGSRTHGFEENGYARKPPACIVVPKGTSSAADSSAGAGTSAAFSTTPCATIGWPARAGLGGGAVTGTRHRFELLGLDFMIDASLKVHFIEVNTNPSLSYQNKWHEGFADEMAERMLDLVFDGVFTEPGRAPPELSEWDGTGTAPPTPGWQFVMNTYNASIKHPGQLGPAPPSAPAGTSSSGGSRAVGGRAAARGPAPPAPLSSPTGAQPDVPAPDALDVAVAADAASAVADRAARATAIAPAAGHAPERADSKSVSRTRLARAGAAMASRKPLPLTVATLQPTAGGVTTLLSSTRAAPVLSLGLDATMMTSAGPASGLDAGAPRHGSNGLAGRKFLSSRSRSAGRSLSPSPGSRSRSAGIEARARSRQHAAVADLPADAAFVHVPPSHATGPDGTGSEAVAGLSSEPVAAAPGALGSIVLGVNSAPVSPSRPGLFVSRLRAAPAVLMQTKVSPPRGLAGKRASLRASVSPSASLAPSTLRDSLGPRDVGMLPDKMLAAAGEGPPSDDE